MLRRQLCLITYFVRVQLVAGVNAVLVVFHYNFRVYRQRTVHGGVSILRPVLAADEDIRYRVIACSNIFLGTCDVCGNCQPFIGNAVLDYYLQGQWGCLDR